MSEEATGGWGFRTSHPHFDVGETVVVYAGPYDEDREQLTARIGDTILYVDGADPAMADRIVEVTVTDFDADRHEGEARLEEVRGKSGL